MEERAMWNILGREMTPYAVSIWIACAAALALFLWQGRSLKKGAQFWTAALGILLGLFCARLYYVLARLKLFLDLGLENFFVCPDEEPVCFRINGHVLENDLRPSFAGFCREKNIAVFQFFKNGIPIGPNFRILRKAEGVLSWCRNG